MTCKLSFGPDQRLRPPPWVDLSGLLLVWHCVLKLWFLQLKKRLSNQCLGMGSHSCLSRNIWHFSRQSHVTGPKTVMLVFDMSFKKMQNLYMEKWTQRICWNWCSLVPVCLDLSSAAWGRKHCCRSHCLPTVIMWCDLKRKTFVSFHNAWQVRISITTQ